MLIGFWVLDFGFWVWVLGFGLGFGLLHKKLIPKTLKLISNRAFRHHPPHFPNAHVLMCSFAHVLICSKLQIHYSLFIIHYFVPGLRPNAFKTCGFVPDWRQETGDQSSSKL